MSCGGCNQVLATFDAITAANPAPTETWTAKLGKLRDRTLMFMAHLLRCCIQQVYINLLMQSVVDNPTHLHMCFDYKVNALCDCFG